MEKKSEEEEASRTSQILFTFATPLFFNSWRKRRSAKALHRNKVLENSVDLPEEEKVNLERSLKGELEEEDFWTLPTSERVENVIDTFQQTYDSYTPKPHDSDTKRLRVAIFTATRKMLLQTALVKLLNTSLQFSYPFLLKQLLFTLQPNSNREISEAYYFAIGLSGAMFLKAMTENTYFWYAAKSGARARLALSSAVYRKSLRLSLASRQSKTLGEIINLMQLDAAKIEVFFTQVQSLWDGVLQIIGYSFILFSIIGWSSFIGLAFMLTMIPVQAMVMRRLMKNERVSVKITDERIKKVNEAIQGILGVKMSAWEDSLIKIISEIRDREVSLLRSSIWLRSFSSSYMMSTPALTAAVALAVYATIQHGNIDAATLFTCLTTFGMLRFPLMLYPTALASYSQALISTKRLAAFLCLDEVNSDKFQDYSHNEDSEVVVELKDVTVYWADPRTPIQKEVLNEKNKQVKTTPTSETQDFSNPVLENISLQIKKGELIAVVGGVGQGKTALLNTILKEMFISKGILFVKEGPIALGAQTPWIMNATIRDNIIFGSEFNQDWYDQVLDACQLRHDLSLLSDYDMTEIGERGVSLSGGQKQRVSTARAAYHSRNSVLTILDDPLSALDPEVGNLLFDECVLGLLQDQTRIIVTNSLDILKECDRILFLTGGEGVPGRIAEQGTFDELMKANSLLSSLLVRHRGEELKEVDTEKKLKKSKSSTLFKKPTQIFKGSSIIKAEERAKGAVKGSIYSGYISAGGGFLVFFLVYFTFIIAQAVSWLNTFWMTLWSTAVNLDGTYKHNSMAFYVVGYTFTGILMAFTAFIRTGALMSMSIRAATNLHRQLLTSVLHAPMSFFDTTPTGRILQRFAQDIKSLDSETGDFINFFLMTTLFVLTSIITIIYVTPIFAAFLLPLMLLYILALSIYRPVMRDAKRIASIATSPVYAHFSETLGGVLTIRAFKVNNVFEETNSTALNRMIKMNYAMKLCERWLGVRLEFLGASISFLASMFAVYGVQQKLLYAGLAGLSISFASNTTTLLTNTVRSFAQVEAGMNSVERVRYMGTEIPQEKWEESEYDNGKFSQKTNWPDQGNISISNLNMRYRENTPLILKNINISIKGGEKIGIAGRTGSGKSSLFLALLRIVEPEPNSKILIDGIDVSTITLFELRSHISIAPQLPILYSGSLRSNLDPFENHSDFEVWDALEKVGLKTSVENLDKGIHSVVSEYGENFSQGERQLISLARAILAKPKILLLDESTASLDADRDKLIQEIIRICFKSATLIVIAHRLDTILNSDRILVLGDGKVLEFDMPSKLMESSDSALRLAIDELGVTQAERLRKQATLKL